MVVMVGAGAASGAAATAAPGTRIGWMIGCVTPLKTATASGRPGISASPGRLVGAAGLSGVAGKSSAWTGAAAAIIAIRLSTPIVVFFICLISRYFGCPRHAAIRCA